MSQEIWKPVPSSPGWLASSDGRICFPTQKRKMPNGGFKNLMVTPTFGHFDKKQRRYRHSIIGRSRPVSQLICEAFHGPKPTPRHECMHLDEDSTNNKSDNLAWGTRSENMRAPKLSKARRERLLSDRHHNRKLTQSDVSQIRSMPKPIDLAAIAATFGISVGYARHIAAGRYR